MVARRRLRRAGRGPARARVVPAAAARLGARRARSRRRLMLAAVAGLSELAFRSAAARSTYLVFPALIWAALRFGRRGATLAIAVAVGFTVWNTTHHDGAVRLPRRSRYSVLSTQLYIAVAALSTLCLAAVVSEREAVRRAASRASRARLVEAADTERRRHRAQPPRRRPAAPDRARRAARLGRRRRARAPRRGRGAVLEEAEAELSAGHRRAARARARHPPGGAHRPRARDGARAGRRALGGPDPASRSCPRRGFDADRRGDRVLRRRRGGDQRPQARGRASIAVRAVAVARHPPHRGRRRRRRRRRPRPRAAGLQGLRDRVEALGGTLDVVSPAGEGTRVLASLPVRPPGRR